MRTLFGVGMAAVLAAGAGCHDKKAEELDGTYLVVGMEIGGERLSEDDVIKKPEAERTVKIAGGKMTGARMDEGTTITFTLDPTKAPKQMTTTVSKSGGESKTMVGIYKLEGDTLTICEDESDKEADRPREFKSENGSKVLILTLKRVKDK